MLDEYNHFHCSLCGEEATHVIEWLGTGKHGDDALFWFQCPCGEKSPVQDNRHDGRWSAAEAAWIEKHGKPRLHDGFQKFEERNRAGMQAKRFKGE